MGVFFVPKLAKLALVSASAARIAAKAYHAGKQVEKRITEFLYPQEEDVIVMKKSTFAAILVFFAAVAGALRTQGALPERFTIQRIGMGAGKRAYDTSGILRAMIVEPLV